MISFKHFFKPTKTPEELAKLHKVSIEKIHNSLRKGVEVEKEHTKFPKIAEKIALAHLEELPDYYDRLKKIEESEIKQIGKSIKRKIGHSLPNRIRSGITALYVTGKMHNPDNKNKTQQYQKFRTSLLSNKHKLPKFKDS
jgi:hypothetical protein